MFIVGDIIQTYLLPSLISTSFVIRAHRKYLPFRAVLVDVVVPPMPFSKSTVSSLMPSSSPGCGSWSDVVISGTGGIAQYYFCFSPLLYVMMFSPFFAKSYDE